MKRIMLKTLMILAIFSSLSTSTEIESADKGKLPPLPIQVDSQFEKM